MSELRSAPAQGRRPVATFPVIATLLAGLLAAGCNAHARATADYSPAWPGEPYRMAAPTPQKVEMEDDGQEAQLPPPARVRTAPDDPSEPWSRNYGSSAARSAGGSAASPPRPQSPAGRRQVADAVPAD